MICLTWEKPPMAILGAIILINLQAVMFMVTCVFLAVLQICHLLPGSGGMFRGRIIHQSPLDLVFSDWKTSLLVVRSASGWFFQQAQWLLPQAEAINCEESATLITSGSVFLSWSPFFVA